MKSRKRKRKRKWIGSLLHRHISCGKGNCDVPLFTKEDDYNPAESFYTSLLRLRQKEKQYEKGISNTGWKV